MGFISLLRLQKMNKSIILKLNLTNVAYVVGVVEAVRLRPMSNLNARDIKM